MTRDITLAFDSSEPHCAVAILDGREVLFHRVEAMTKGQAERLPVLIETAMTEVGLAPSDLSRIGVGTGPGNFTGTRISVALARGIALGVGIQAQGVSAIEAYGDGRDVTVCLPAPRGRVILGHGTHIETQGIEDAVPEGMPNRVCGPAAEDVAVATGAVLLDTPDLAPAIGLATRKGANTIGMRPAPVYLRPADAAPTSDLPPRIL
ncbi:tRNA N6-adenosine(37)-N6-threonylcarbamoyltransferase complex dimerization subunit TsaB [Jannaschia pagri]|uniref:tRNA N6-adenosine(37)-N6-threonylcarbamoyltransferase complex dimerization subunit TsaB n=1 Tax=Jannaschia pagri TaxID=2829797 RepID=A0ABQ4NLH4_9RHOB|nr:MULTISPECIES: tRNA (adenosine(37)-N6)-threonylcarbamoyltransferase complex dimerization subunit type 1 TsaB [unclassified Jannaschia]GIT91252.1 tRNA N6-adenosine(37)-N6-threonylcarbamoyltransferase complex dimerization subunit TsaB [Jannaschia sp. AI_61]GIT95085.1 tRNA N6-adenosine(37)-N6-threonylcarbamoyltransferase complex dimerization subunit TsaB [Jannaschia sp. AI_62]